MMRRSFTRKNFSLLLRGIISRSLPMSENFSEIVYVESTHCVSHKLIQSASYFFISLFARSSARVIYD